MKASPVVISISSLENPSPAMSRRSFAFQIVAETLSWVGYSLDEKDTVIINKDTIVRENKQSTLSFWTGNLGVY
jgi:hypothetical protein